MMSDTGSASNTVSRKRTTKSRSWGSAWLTRLERASAFSDEALERGRAYALHDWQLEVDLQPGRAEALARSGPRIRNRASIEAPLLSEADWSIVIGLIADSSARTAALLDHDLDLAILGEAKSKGVHLIPPPQSLVASCSCRNWGELCKHSSAVVFLLADVFDEAPFDLLLWRGLPYEDLVEQVRQARRSTNTVLGPQASTEPSSETSSVTAGTDQAAGSKPQPAMEMVAALDAWNRTQIPLPQPLQAPDKPAEIPPYPSDAPSNAPFTGAGLHSLVVDAVLRAHRQRQGAEGSMLDLTVDADLARRAALLEGSDDWATLVLHSQRPARELSRQANAWRVAGSAGVQITQSSRETLEINKFVQFRKNDDGQWFRFEKVSGRWLLISGPASDPVLLQSQTDDSTPEDQETPGEQDEPNTV